jgi:Flp pilus assembly protein TadD
VLRTIARTAFGAGRPATAVQALEPLARMHPEVAEYSYQLGVAWLQLGDAAEAILALERARELRPAHALGHVALGMALNRRLRGRFRGRLRR